MCNTRRMAETAAHLVDHVFPPLTVRQWVLSVPKRLRYFLQRDGAALNTALRIFLRVILHSLHEHCTGAAQIDPATLRIGAVAFIHRFGASLNAGVCIEATDRARLERLLRYCARYTPETQPRQSRQCKALQLASSSVPPSRQRLSRPSAHQRTTCGQC